jgi:hypothetical protein
MTPSAGAGLVVCPGVQVLTSIASFWNFVSTDNTRYQWMSRQCVQSLGKPKNSHRANRLSAEKFIAEVRFLSRVLHFRERPPASVQALRTRHRDVG